MGDVPGGWSVRLFCYGHAIFVLSQKAAENKNKMKQKPIDIFDKTSILCLEFFYNACFVVVFSETESSVSSIFSFLFSLFSNISVSCFCQKQHLVQ